MNIKKKLKLLENEKEAPSSNFENIKDNESINNDYNNNINGKGSDIRYVESMPNIQEKII